MKITQTIRGLRKQVCEWRKRGSTVGLVPTMGALHDGHLSLVDSSVRQCDRTIVTLFVNPIQFGPEEDFESYPRQERMDRGLLRSRKCDLLFAPTVEEMFPDGHSIPDQFKTTVLVRGLSDGLCGPLRPGHFMGVATEVLKTLIIILPDVVYLGEKDYQQLQVIRRMARDLSLPMEIEGVPTVRASDGLALSSRNAYLTPEERRIGPALYRTLCAIAQQLGEGEHAEPLLRHGRESLLKAGFDKVDYVTLVNAETLDVVENAREPARLLAAAWIGRARLIDNVAVKCAGIPHPDHSHLPSRCSRVRKGAAV